MKKLVFLLLVCLLALCAAAQAAPKIEDLSTYALHAEIKLTIDSDTVITGKAEVPVFIDYIGGEITLRNVSINSDDVGLKLKKPDDDIVILDLEESERPVAPTVTVKLEGENEIFGLYGAINSNFALNFEGSGSLDVTGGVGLFAEGPITIDGADIEAIGYFPDWGCAIGTMNGSISVKNGSLIAYYDNQEQEENNNDQLIPMPKLNVIIPSEPIEPIIPSEPIEPIEPIVLRAAYLNLNDDERQPSAGKVSTAGGYTIRTGNSPETAVATGAYNGELYLEITKLVEPEIEPTIPETGDGANLVLWTLMLAASVLGVLSMRRKAY